MKVKKKGYGILLGLTIILTLAAIVKLIPNFCCSKECKLGYKSLCFFAPIGTIILLLIAGVVCKIRKKKFTEEKEEEGTKEEPKQTNN